MHISPSRKEALACLLPQFSEDVSERIATFIGITPSKKLQRGRPKANIHGFLENDAVAVSTSNSHVSLWCVETFKLLRQFPTHQKDMLVSMNSKHIAIYRWSVVIFDLQSGARVFSRSPPQGTNAISLSKNSQYVAIGGEGFLHIQKQNCQEKAQE